MINELIKRQDFDIIHNVCENNNTPEGEEMASLIEIRNMCKIYNPGENEVRALDHVSLSIGENEFVAIIGH